MFDPYEAWLGIPPEQRPPTFYQLLDVPANETNPEVIRQAAMRRMSGLLARPDRMHGGLCAQLINEISQAQAVLLDPVQRQEYDSQLAPQTTRPVTSEWIEPAPDVTPQAELIQPSSAIEGRSRRPAPAKMQEVRLPVLSAPDSPPAKPAASQPTPKVNAPPRRFSGRFWLWVIAAEIALAVLVLAGYFVFWSHGPVTAVRDTKGRGVSPTLLPTAVTPTQPEPEAKPDPEPKPEPETKPAAPMHGEARAEAKGEDRGGVKPPPRHRANPQARPPQSVKPPPPAGEVLSRAEKLIRDVFGDDLARRKPGEVMAVVTKMLAQARNTRDAAARYVMLRDAAIQAAQSGNAAAALGAIDELAHEFAVPSLEMKTAAMEAAIKAPGVSTNRSLVESILSVIDDAIAADSPDHAVRLLKSAESAAKVVKIVPAPGGIAVRTRELDQLRKEWEAVAPARQTLASRPDDPAANLALGRYLCFCKADWRHGLIYLTRSGDARLQQLAENDMAGPLSADEQLAVADGWWDLSDKETGLLRTRLQERAVAWYTQALPRLDGLDKEKAEKRIRLLASNQPPAGTTMALSTLRDIRELGEAKFPGDWSLKGGKLHGPREELLWFNPYFSGDFWVSMVFVQGTAPHALTFGPGAVYAKDEFWLIEISPEGQLQLRISQGRELTPKSDFKVEPGRRVLSVRLTGPEVIVFIDGRQKLSYTLDADMPPAHRFGLYTATGDVTIETLSFGSNRTSGPRFEIVPEFTVYEGKWSFKYATFDGKMQITTEYVIDGMGNVLEPGNKDRRGVLTRRGNEVLIEYLDGSVERIAKYSPGRLQTQTYANIKTYPNMPTMAGVGVKK